MDGFVVCHNFIVKKWNIVVCLKKETYLAQSGTHYECCLLPMKFSTGIISTNSKSDKMTLFS